MTESRRGVFDPARATREEWVVAERASEALAALESVSGGTRAERVPPTGRPERGQGPWRDLSSDCWWVVAERASEALAALESVDARALPIYHGWRAEIERVHIRYVAPERWSEEAEIEECRSNNDGAVKAWRVRVWLSDA